MTPKIATLTQLATAEWRASLERDAMLDLRAYRRENALTVEELARLFACSHDSVERYLTGARPVPGYIVLAIRDRRAA